MCKDFDSFATEHNSGDAAAAMRRHHDYIAFSTFCCVYNRFVRLIMLDAHQLTGHA